jgi:transposase-like protein
MRTATQGAQARADEGSRLTAAGHGVTDVIVCEELGISARQLRRWRDECRGFDADDTTTMTLVRFPVGDVICQAKGREKNKYKNCT